MKIKNTTPIFYFAVAVIFLFCNKNVVAQNSSPNAGNFETYLKEVYANDEGKAQVAPATRRYEYLKELYTTRIKYVKQTTAHDVSKGYKKLSGLALYDLYNENLERDKVFNPLTFNPFKYDFSLYSKTTEAYRVEGTDYLIVIYPQKTSPSVKMKL